ncbi:MAG: hypothetical protein ACI4QT_04635 [Kiritimatiellia bacterium]
MEKHKRYVVVAELESIQFIKKNGVRPSTETRHLLTGTAVWPRTGIPSRSYSVEIKAGESKDYAQADWIQSILFKETLQAPTALKVQLTVPLAPEFFDSLKTQLAKVLAKETGKLVEDSVPGLMGDLLSVPVDWLGAYLASASPDILGEGILSLDEKTLSNGGSFTIELKAPSTRYREENRAKSGPGGGKVSIRRKVATAGETVAKLTLKLYPVE